MRMTTKTTVLDFVNIDEGNEAGSSGKGLYNKRIAVQNLHNIPLSNFVGFVSDGLSNMMGTVNSTSSRLRDSLPGISVFKCVSHRLYICASEAAKTLSWSCEDLMYIIFFLFISLNVSTSLKIANCFAKSNLIKFSILLSMALGGCPSTRLLHGSWGNSSL